MRRVNINGTYYTLAPESRIIKRAVSPWKARVTSGSLEYSDFSQAELEEYHDFRNGIGLESALPSESARTWWTNGVDVTSSRSAVLNPRVNTAGSFGQKPIEIIDFQDSTYAIGATAIKKWNATTEAWTVQGALVEDCEDVWVSAHHTFTVALDNTIYKVGSGSVSCDISGTREELAIYENFSAIDLSNFTKINLWFKSNDAFGSADLVFNLDDTSNCASPIEAIDFPAYNGNNLWQNVTLTLASPASCTAIVSVGITTNEDCNGRKFWIDQIVADGYVGNSVSATTFLDSTDEYLVISASDAAMKFDGTTWSYLEGCQGYIVPYQGKLSAIDTDGNTVRQSPKGDIDGTWTTFDLAEDIGTVYTLFAGKLLADDTPVLYFTSNKGLFSIDVPNEICYRQEVNYPPTTYAGHAGVYYNASIYVATGAGVTKVAPSLATPTGADQDDGLPEDYQGTVYDMVGVNNYIVYAINGSTSTLFERNTGGNDTPWVVHSTTWGAQTFTPVITHYIGSVKVHGYIVGTAGTMTVSIRAVDGSSQPTGPDLASGTTNANTITTSASGEWREITFGTAYEITAGTKYAIVMRTTGADVNNCFKWSIETGSPTYPGGQSEASTDSGSSWTGYDYDLDFEEYGHVAKSSIMKHHTNMGGNLQVYSTSAANKAIQCIHHSSSSMYSNGRLWFGEDTDVKYMMFPDTTSNMKNLASYEYASASDTQGLILPRFRKLAAISKTALGVAAVTKGCDASEYLTLYYRINDTSSWTTLGTYQSSPLPTMLTFNSGLGTAFYTIQFALKFQRGSTITNTPELESLLFYYLPTPTSINAWTFNIQATEDDAEKVISDLETLRDTNTLVTFYPSGDTAQTSYSVKLTNMPLQFYCDEQQSRKGYIAITVEEIFNG